MYPLSVIEMITSSTGISDSSSISPSDSIILVLRSSLYLSFNSSNSVLIMPVTLSGLLKISR